MFSLQAYVTSGEAVLSTARSVHKFIRDTLVFQLNHRLDNLGGALTNSFLLISRISGMSEYLPMTEWNHNHNKVQQKNPLTE